jgi:cell division protein FtsI (penicillin-binding protein 3)
MRKAPLQRVVAFFGALLGRLRGRAPRNETGRRRRGDPQPGVNRADPVRYSSSPLMAAKTPPLRSKLLVLALGLGSLVLAGRALYIQVINPAFFQKQGANRYERHIELQASRGRIVDRNGQLLASQRAGALGVGHPQLRPHRPRLSRCASWPAC